MKSEQEARATLVAALVKEGKTPAAAQAILADYEARVRARESELSGWARIERFFGRKGH